MSARPIASTRIARNPVDNMAPVRLDNNANAAEAFIARGEFDSACSYTVKSLHERIDRAFDLLHTASQIANRNAFDYRVRVNFDGRLSLVLGRPADKLRAYRATIYREAGSAAIKELRGLL